MTVRITKGTPPFPFLSSTTFGYISAAALLLVHAAIAYADAVAIEKKGWKSRGDDHLDAVALLRETVASTPEASQALVHLERVIQEKTRASYTGQSLRETDLMEIRKRVERFQFWARKQLPT